MTRICKSRAKPRCDGNVAIEYGFILPVLLLFTFGIADFGRLLWTDITLNRATEAAARCAAVGDTTTCPNVPAYAVAQASGIGDITTGAFTVTSSANCGQTTAGGVQVSATYTFSFIIPWFPQFGGTALGTKTLTASACYTKQ